MEKKTILAIVLSMAVMIGFFMIQAILNPPPEYIPLEAEPQGVRPIESSGIPAPEDIQIPDTYHQEQDTAAGSLQAIDEIIPHQNIIIETDILIVELTNAGGNIVSYQLKDHLDSDRPVEMILTGDNNAQAFAVAFGNTDDILAGRIQPETSNFHIRQISSTVVEFYRNFISPAGVEFIFTKRYDFRPGEYMFELRISLNTTGTTSQAFDFPAYTLMFGPQIGPGFVRLDNRYEYRRYQVFSGNRMRNERVNDRVPTIVDTMPGWAAIEGKYFALIAIPNVNQYEIAFAASPEPGLPAASRMMISRPTAGSFRVDDVYQFYLGPKNQENLNIYERGDNSFRLRDTGLYNIAETTGFLAPLENILKWFLVLFHRIIPNYGIAIILLTLLVKIVMFPLTRKSSEAQLRMQALSPKIKELQEKYKDNKQKLNLEMAELYKKGGYNPISGCLPMLLQFPIFFAMFNLFNNHFDLRGAEFIPFWITDLSRPEFIYEFAEGVTLPLLGWTAIRLLPFIYVGSQLLYGKVTQTPEQQGNKNMKLMMYALPVVFFFILYDMPSGLLVYWIMSNILTMVQQVIINKFMAKKKAAQAALESTPVIAPGGSRKKKKINRN